MISHLAPGYPAALFEAFAEYIGVELGFEVGRSGPDPLVDPFAAGTADLGWVCSTSFVELTTDRPASVQEVGVAWVPDDPDAGDRPGTSPMCSSAPTAMPGRSMILRAAASGVTTLPV